ncbi:Nramp family divalent metal transporter [Cyclobacterium sp. 1_MG-2023]|uniref:Nramp family divalent metal transporter n=1 Tax=Cyclobacterium sp. 1_MG-2023 TaxID=3062681 RepID=UPI0026E286EA|nr:Nramp family divalent metal transporter [Cyclobacterium sp. 1_MG-2023]MDO6438592.1 Nramp family divalent metal transporter [Cyclobacterium sp. 1_MG-2023]
MKDNAIFKKIIFAISLIGPGLFLIGYNIGTGSITTMAKVGAEYGMMLTWALMLSCIFTYVLMVAYGKTTLVTGNTALFNIKHKLKYGSVLAVYIIIALVIGEIMALMGIFGIIADLIQEGSRLILGGEGFSTFWITLVLVVALYSLFWFGNYLVFEKVLVFFVALMVLSFIVVFILLKPDFTTLVSGMAPSIPDEPGVLRLIAAIAGTTCSAAVFIIRSTVVAEKGWTIKDLKHEKKDSMVSATMMFILSVIIMAVAAGTLHVMGLKLDNTVEMIKLFEPIGGELAAFILILGIVGAGISTVFPIILIAPWLISDFTGKPRDIKSPMYRLLAFVGILFGFGMQFMEARPPLIMVFSQAFQAFILPAVAIPVFLLINNKKLMKNNVAGIKENIGLVAVILFSLLTAYFAVAEFI